MLSNPGTLFLLQTSTEFLIALYAGGLLRLHVIYMLPTCGVANETQCTPGFNTKNYNITNYSRENITYHSQNVINLVSCNQCNVQYVCETTLPLHERINLNRRAQSGGNYVINYSKMFTQFK